MLLEIFNKTNNGYAKITEHKIEAAEYSRSLKQAGVLNVNFITEGLLNYDPLITVGLVKDHFAGFLINLEISYENYGYRNSLTFADAAYILSKKLYTGIFSNRDLFFIFTELINKASDFFVYPKGQNVGVTRDIVLENRNVYDYLVDQVDNINGHEFESWYSLNGSVLSFEISMHYPTKQRFLKLLNKQDLLNLKVKINDDLINSITACGGGLENAFRVTREDPNLQNKYGKLEYLLNEPSIVFESTLSQKADSLIQTFGNPKKKVTIRTLQQVYLGDLVQIDLGIEKIVGRVTDLSVSFSESIIEYNFVIS